MRFSVLSVAALSAVLLTGCLAVERHVEATTTTADPWAAVALFDANGRPLEPAVREGQEKRPLNVLALSGGGADGAFGAGVLVGWTETGARPSFDIVTGVSTGALQSTFAFLGSSYDAALTDLYTRTDSHEVFADRGIGGIFSDSLKDTEPLKQRIAEVVTPAVLEAVAAEHRKGRRLYVATTNLDAGTVTVWDMGRLAASDSPNRAELYREVLRASAAVPGFFRPVFIQPTSDAKSGQMHVDGAVKAPILLRTFMLEGKGTPKNVYLIVNGALRLRTAGTPVSADLGGIAKKSITELMRGLLYKTIYQTYVVVRQSKASFNLAYIPDDVPETTNALEFRPHEMMPLFEAGRRAARAGGLWRAEPPRLESAERIVERR